jgi:hypothetical protein
MMLKSSWIAVFGVPLIAAAALAGSGGCVRLEVQRNYNVESKEGVQAIVTATDRCSRDVDGKSVSFVVKALDSQGRVLGSAAGHFDTVITSAGGGETQIFVRCDVEKFRKLEVKEL